MAKRIGERPKVSGKSADLGDRLLALGDRRGIEGDPDRQRCPGSSIFRRRLRPSYGRVSGGRSRSPVSSFQSPPLKPLTTRDRMPTERSKRASALAKYSQWPDLRLTRKSSTGSSVAVDDFHLQGVSELTGFAEISFERAGARDDARQADRDRCRRRWARRSL